MGEGVSGLVYADPIFLTFCFPINYPIHFSSCRLHKLYTSGALFFKEGALSLPPYKAYCKMSFAPKTE